MSPVKRAPEIELVTRWFSGSPCKRHGCIDACEAKRDLRKLLRERAEAAARAYYDNYPRDPDNPIRAAMMIRAAVMGRKP